MESLIKTDERTYKLRDKQELQQKYIKINLTMNHYYKLLWSSESFEILDLESPLNFQVKEKIIFKSVHK